MRAFVLEKYGSPLRAVDMPAPVAGEHEVIVRVVAAGVNHGDERLRSGEFRLVFPFTLPMVVGSELAGEVVAVGSGVTRFSPGMPVIAYADLSRMGAFAEMVAIDQRYVAQAPTSIDLTQAAALPVSGLTAWQGLVELGRLQAGQTVLIHGGSGAVGSVAIQLAKHLGARVVTTAGADKANLVRELGADVVIDYRTEDFAERVSDVDLVLDTQGGDILTRSLGVLRPGGTVIGITGPPDPDFAVQAGANPVVRGAIRALSSRVRRRASQRGVRYRFLFIQPDGDDLRALVELVDQGVIRLLVDRVLPFGQTAEALQTVASGGARGKVLVTTDGDGDAGAETGADADADAALGELAPTWATAPTRRIEVGRESLAYRELGVRAGVPVLLLTHLAATLDEWDPRVVDALAREHHVIAVDLPGVGGSTGRVPHAVADMATAAIGFVEAMGLSTVDVVGFSLGGFVAQQLTLDRPDLVRRLVLTGTGPAGGEGIDRPTGAAYVYADMARAALARTDAKEFLFFERDRAGKAAAKDYLARIAERTMDRDEPITVRAFRTQLEAIKAWGRAEPQDLSVITAPTLIANGDHDRMVPSALSEDLHRKIPGSTLVIYPDSGHGGVFQHGEDFTRALLKHLA